MSEESRSLSFSGVRLHFNVVAPEGPVKNRILLLGSPLLTAFNWRKLAPALTDLGCLLVLADLPGFGRSDPDAPTADDARAHMLWGVLDDVDANTDAPMSMWHLAGHGTGCATILHMAAAYPDSVKSQIHICPTFSVAPPGRRGEDVRRFDAEIGDAKRFHRMIERYAGYPMDDYIVSRMRAPLIRPGARDMLLRALHAASKPPTVGMGFCPTIAFCGGRDPLADATREAQMRKLLPDAELHRVGAFGHFPMETHSRMLRDYLRGWLKYND